MHLAAAALLTLGSAAGLIGLGELAGGRTAGDRWVRGWIIAWWAIALAAQLLGPRTGVGVGLALLASGVAVSGLRWRNWGRAPVLLAAAILAGGALWLAPPAFYDALVYHLGLPWTWLVNGGFQPIEHDLFSRFPLAGETVFLVPVALGLPEAAAGLHWATFVVCLLAATRLARRLGAGRFAWVAPALLLACWHAVYLAGVASVDHLVVLGVLVAVDHLAAADWPAWPRVAGCGLGLGLAAGAKYPALIPAAVLLLAATALRPRAWVRTAAAGAIAAATASFWLARNLLQTGNPFFPLLWSVFGGRGWTARDDARYLHLVREGGGLAAIPAGLAHLVVPPAGLGWWALAALPLVGCAVLARREERGPARLAALAAALAALGWLATSQTTRYALPAAALVAALAAGGLGALRPRLARGLALLLAAVGAHGAVTLAAFAHATLRLDRLWSGAWSAEEWRHAVTVDDPTPAYRACARLPADARVLVVGEGRPYGCPRPHHASSPYDLQFAQDLTERSATSAELAGRLRALGFTHLLVNAGELERLGGPDFQVLRWRNAEDAGRWRAFLGEETVPLWLEGGLAIRAIRPPAAAR